MSAQRRRLVAAAALVAFALLACLGIDAAAQKPNRSDDAALPPDNAWTSAEERDVVSSLFSQTAHPPAISSDVPPEVRAEVLVGFTMADEEFYAQDTVGLLLPCAADEAQRYAADALASQGWTSVGEAASSDRGLTFVKRQGVYRWLFMQVFESEGAATVVLTLQGDAHGQE